MPSENLQEVQIYIVGPSGIQNELLASFLEKETGYPCSTSSLEGLLDRINSSPCRKRLLMFDCSGTENTKQWKSLFKKHIDQVAEDLIVLFNVDPNSGIEKDAVLQGIRGIFYLNDQMNIFAKGVTDVVAGELWYSRRVMSDFLLKRGAFNAFSKNSSNVLTFREKEILIGIASGASNQELSDSLGISLHTVKTHIYNIYKKINVPNRLQAALWASQYL